MLKCIKRVLDNAGVTPEDAAALAALVATPPAGTFDPAELGAANEVQVALLAAIAAAGRSQQFGTALQRLLTCVDAAQASLSDYDRGRFWHLKGMAAWRLDDALYSATRALNRGITLLQGLETLPAQAYLGRIFDTFGQILQHQGLLHDARLEFERALVCKRAGKDRYGMALTLGNLGRLCMELGNFAATAKYIRSDLRLMSASPQPETARLRLQLLSHLGTCALECSKRRPGQPQPAKLQEAREACAQSASLAQANAAHDGLAFAALGLGKAALLETDLAEAQRQARSVRLVLQRAFEM